MRKTFKGANEIILNVKSTGMRLNGMEEMSEAICNESVRWGLEWKNLKGHAQRQLDLQSDIRTHRVQHTNIKQPARYTEAGNATDVRPASVRLKWVLHN